MGGTYTAPVMATRTVTTCIGNNGNCCVQYDDSKKMWRDSLIIILKTPYCIGTLLALFLHLMLPFEMEEEEVGENVQEKPSVGELSAQQIAVEPFLQVWFEFLFGSLLSGNQLEDWKTVNPFLSEQELQLLSDLAALTMLRSNRLGLLSRALEELNRVRMEVQLLESGTPLSDRKLVMAQACSALSGTLRSRRAYAPHDLEGDYDPRFLAFEFTRNMLLRDNQVDLVKDFVTSLETAKKDAGGCSAMVKQMIMGQVCPLLVLMLADGKQLVVLVVPGALLDMSRRVLRATFASVLTKKVGTFECERSSSFDPHLLRKLEKAKTSGAAVVTVPTSVKSLMLRMIELMMKLQTKGKEADTAVTETRSQVRQLSKALALFRQGAVLMDEVDVVLHPLKSELNFPYGPKEPLDGSSPRAFRWTLPMHLFEAFFLAQAIMKAGGKIPANAEAHLSGAQGTRYK
ncbi:unnamed protein product, partial [Symbiodinium sp. CCMP2456]